MESSQPLRYPVPWRTVFGLWPRMARYQRTDLDRFTSELVAQMKPAPRWSGLENLPADPRFVVVANHFQRKGMWILHPAAVITQAIRRHYGALEPAVRWVVTANWPRWGVGRWQIPSPGDLLLPRVAHTLWCYAIPFAGTDPGRTARSLRQLLRDAYSCPGPFGLFPEGVAGVAGRLSEPLEGTGRLLAHLAKAGRPVVPAAIFETFTLEVQFGAPIPPSELSRATDAAVLAMRHVAELLRGSR